MHRDRGNIKWQGFFIPEHIKMLKDAERDYYKSPRPQLDEAQIEDMERLLSESMAHQTTLEITTWENGYFNLRVGFVQKIDRLNKKIQFQDELDSLFSINFFSITNVIIK